MITINTSDNTGYWNGTKVHLTGKFTELFGEIFHQAIILDGHLKGTLIDTRVRNENELFNRQFEE